jgi:hypothetical protein
MFNSRYPRNLLAILVLLSSVGASAHAQKTVTQAAKKAQRAQIKQTKTQAKQAKAQVRQAKPLPVPPQRRGRPVVVWLPKYYTSILGRGMDVDWSKTGPGTRYYNEQTVKDFKEIGLSHVRIRVADDVSPALLAELDKQVNDCLNNGVIPIIAYQANAFKVTASQAELDKAVQWWDSVASYFRKSPPALSFDLIIEVTDAMNDQPDLLNEYFEKATAAIRKTNATRILFISPRVRSSPEYLKDLKIPSQAGDFIMAEWHFYAAGPSKTNPARLWTTGTPQEKQIILDKIKLAKDWQAKTGILTWVGAWMPSNYNDGNDYTADEQIGFARFVSAALDSVYVPFAVNSDTKFYNRETNQWIPETLPVLKTILKP